MQGEVIHFTEIEPGDTLKIYPNYYDFEFLDSTSRRYDITLDENCLRRSNATNFSVKPYFLDELDQKFLDIWEKIKKLPAVTDTKLRNIESLWLTKIRDWKVDLTKKDSESFKQWNKLVESTLKQEFGDVDEMLRESIHSGLFFDCLELNLKILKEKVKKPDETK